MLIFKSCTSVHFGANVIHNFDKVIHNRHYILCKVFTLILYIPRVRRNMSKLWITFVLLLISPSLGTLFLLLRTCLMHGQYGFHSYIFPLKHHLFFPIFTSFFLKLLFIFIEPQYATTNVYCNCICSFIVANEKRLWKEHVRPIVARCLKCFACC